MNTTTDYIEGAIDELADQIADRVKAEARRLLRSGGAPEHNENRRMWLPKMLVTVAAETAAKDYWNSVDKEWVASVKNLRKF